MAMTTTEIYSAVLPIWEVSGFISSPIPLGRHLATLRHHADLFLTTHDFGKTNFNADSSVLRVLTQAWGLLRWYAGMPVDRPSHYYNTPHRGDSPSDTPPPIPSELDLDSYALTIPGVIFTRMPPQDYGMMVSTYVNDLMSAWKLDTTTMWTDTSTEITRYLFETCKQYLLRHGITD